jgi:hypothetical protein
MSTHRNMLHLMILWDAGNSLSMKLGYLFCVSQLYYDSPHTLVLIIHCVLTALTGWRGLIEI